MALYQRGQIWYADFYANGKRVQESTGTANRREAQKFLDVRLSESHRGVYVKPVHASLNELWERYIGYAKAHKRSWKRDEQMYAQLSGFFGPAALDAITPLKVEEFQQHRVRQVTPASVNREVALLKHMFNVAERWDLYRGTNPVRLVRFLPENNLQFQTLSHQQERTLLACCPAYLQDVIVFGLNSGLRCGDVFSLKWNQVDLEQRRLNLLIQKTLKPISIPINDAAFGVLNAWYGIRKCPYVFYNHMTGDRFRDLKAGFKLACKQAGLKGVTWHTLRHTFASRLIRSGTDIVTVKELLGHSTIVVTMRYAHTNDETKTRAVNAISSGDRIVTVTPKPRRTRK
jgi:integrase